MFSVDGAVRRTAAIAGAAESRFGAALCALDLDGDGAPELVVGAPDQWGGSMRIGSVHVLFLDAQRSVASAVNITEGSAGSRAGCRPRATTAGVLELRGCRFGRALASAARPRRRRRAAAVAAESDHNVGSSAESSVRVGIDLRPLHARRRHSVRTHSKIANGLSGRALGLARERLSAGRSPR